MKEDFAQRAIDFHSRLRYSGGELPPGIRVMNPFTEFPGTLDIATQFFRRYYSDNRPRHLILGINPGRLGAALTGIPFTDPKRLMSVLNIPYTGKIAHEPSSVFIYEMIEAYGGPDLFYKDFYISSPCPLGFLSVDAQGRETNYNYYDSAALIKSATPFMIKSIEELVRLGVETKVGFCLGTGKNASFLETLNAKHAFFERIVPLEHPRYIMQYKSKSKAYYIDKYLQAFKTVINSSNDL